MKKLADVYPELVRTAPAETADHTQFNRVNLDGISLAYLHAPQSAFLACSGTHIDAHHATMHAATIGACTFTDANFDYADLSHASIINTTLTDCAAMDMNARASRWHRTTMVGSRFLEVDARRAVFADCRAHAGTAWAFCDFHSAQFVNCDFSGADFSGCNFAMASFHTVNFAGADLFGCSFQGASMHAVNLDKATLPAYQICPQVGAFAAYKMVAGGSVLQLEIPAAAARTSTLTGRKCRAQSAEVWGCIAGDITADEWYSIYDPDFTYRRGQLVEADSFDPDITKDCGHGIHFFMTYEEARDYTM